ncbi:protein MpCYP716-like21 [Marchantia polymorpha subsp. ruderalis]|uniref:Cytochrome P450 n=2 Tax=Marchantia polymorpha TaxID=3197 RepID=A0A176VQF9_MARPO|nr:hypothetical protein AXG93_3986s1040 [Marchantia polymorpha subsp. ruderalis]PTQ44198.1 hypothetical protein MARPO_0021s0062 [Marchantia polymorpha]BBN01273.1 hypothetical protein Mp_2g06070 [Marchantia polymorpha subsp. ruderalis]|eukprot:PTQ44198.1 hypothetical protein MARPO_0021s0062 [Marchantia polymorpha]
MNTLQNVSSEFYRVSDAFASKGSGVFLVFILSLSTLAFASIILRVSSTDRVHGRLPPGSFGFPFIGESIQYYASQKDMDALGWFKKKREKYGPLFKSRVDGFKTILLDSPGGWKFMYSEFDENVIRVLYPPTVRDLTGPDSPIIKHGRVHRVYKSFLLNHFSGVDVVHRYIPTIGKVAVDHINSLWLSRSDNSEVKAQELLQEFTFSIIGILILGITDSSVLEDLRPKFEEFVNGFVRVSFRLNLPGFQYHRSMKARSQIHEILQRSLVKRRAELEEGKATSTQDYLSVMLTHSNEDGYFYRDAEIRDIMLNLLWAGFESTATTMTMMMMHISRNPQVYDELIKEHAGIASKKAEGEALTLQELRSMKYTWAVMQETLRVSPSSADINRVAMVDLEYKGFTIPKGYRLTAAAGQSQWNPDRFPDPTKFDPSRFVTKTGTRSIEPYIFFPFGSGLRHCPGYELARINTMTLFHHLLRNVKWTMVYLEEKCRYRFLFYPEKGLPIRITKCKAY